MKAEIFCQDAIKWLKKQPNHSLENVVTGIPDFDETPYQTMPKYIEFFQLAVKLIFQKCKKDGYCLFMNTDRKYQKNWIDKSFLIHQIAHQQKIPLKWHKIILLRPVGSTHIQRPTYQHYMCFSYQGGPGEATPDVITCGRKAYKNANCESGVKHAIGFLKRYAPALEVVDPFVGRGSILIEAKKAKFDRGIGVDLDPEQCRRTRSALGMH